MNTAIWGLLLAATALQSSLADTTQAGRSTGYELLYTGSYQVQLRNPDSHLNCRAAAGMEAPVVRRYRHGKVIEALRLVDTSPWFEVSDGCYVRANSAWLRWVGEGEDPSTMCDPRTEPC